MRAVKNSIFRGFIPHSSIKQALRANSEIQNTYYMYQVWSFFVVLIDKTPFNRQFRPVSQSARRACSYELGGMNPLNIEFSTTFTLVMRSKIVEFVIAKFFISTKTA